MIDARDEVSLTSRASFEAAVAPHWEVMTRFCDRLVGQSGRDDLLQDALTQAWRRRETFDPSRGSARSWLLAIIADKARKRRRSFRETEQFHDDLLASSADQDVRLDVDAAIAGLSHRQRVAVCLFYYLGYQVADIAVVMACSEGTVKSTLSDARVKLRARLRLDAE